MKGGQLRRLLLAIAPAPGPGARVVGLTLLAVAIALGACGKKAPPVAPERRLPATVTDLTAAVEGDTVALSWKVPRRRADDTPLRDLVAFRVHRREEMLGAPLKPAMLSDGEVVGYDAVATIRLEATGPAVIQGAVARWADRGLRVGHRYVYVVTAMDSLGRSSAPSERRAVVFLAAPRAPQGLSASAGEREVQLAWDPPAGLLDGGPLRGETRYVVLRGTGLEGALEPITAEPKTALSFTDTSVTTETTYRYAVRAVRLEPEGIALGQASAPVVATPADRTPPGAPEGLVAVPTAASVALSWRPSPDEDLALYAVYRAVSDGPFVRVGTVVPPATTWTDRDVRRGARYRYAVTAIDRARQANESARSGEARVSVP